MTNTSLIAVDWGTTSLRAWRLSVSGEILDRKRGHLGILQVEGGDFPRALEETLGDWMREAPEAPVLMSGMIGSRQGWAEAAYAECPAGLADVARQILTVPGHPRVRIVPGLSFRPAGAAPDVMRGEETQIFGLGIEDGLAILPGTHSKWCRLIDDRVEWFATFMTGEVYSVLKTHSILGRLMEGNGGAPGPGFGAGLSYALSDGAPGLLQSLFSARTRGLFGEVAADELPGYLSGLLIGNEVREGLAALRSVGPSPTSVTLVGADALVSFYSEAFAAAGLPCKLAGEDSGASGLYRIARAAGLIQEQQS
ncbi:2-dehydro-3-deoxygalactonokinase [Faunimonas pinastri]|uniref:2-dehydro-3-deoxygalactonokinase n=1 Tax=Faunimonas pinastri TaxID=1855383 RepID=A0A1H9NRN0_9HYPH|nr:2-dehydro-3-deoxygalactonokinase [Faunimonas pinastri]SER38616.1 2-dehydro-3-deoxygalactonokinase [Faunimonas pinastri]